MKRQFFLLLLFLTAIGIETAGASTLRLVATTEDLASIAKAVGGDRVQVDFIARGIQDPHFIDPKPSYILKLSKADVLVSVGLGLEDAWLPPLLKGARNARIQPGASGLVVAATGLPLLDVPSGRVDRSEGDVHGAGNPHIWLDPENGHHIAKNIHAALIRVDPSGKAVYAKNLDGFLKKLDRAMVQWKERMRPFKGEKVITYHKSWPYFLGRFGLMAVDYVEPRPGIPPGTTHLQGLIERIKSKNVSVLIVEPYLDGKMTRWIAKQTGITVVTLPPSVSEQTGIRDYFALFEHLTQTLARVFSQEGG